MSQQRSISSKDTNYWLNFLIVGVILQDSNSYESLTEIIDVQHLNEHLKTEVGLATQEDDCAAHNGFIAAQSK